LLYAGNYGRPIPWAFVLVRCRWQPPGGTPTYKRLPEKQRPDLLARVRVTSPSEPDAEAALLAAAISRRRTDRRAFGDRPAPEDILTRLRRLVEARGAYMHVVPDDRVPDLAISVDQAADANYFDPAHRGELTGWTHRPAWTGDGVPPSTAVQPGLGTC
jgi:hypothetical protein